jgi:hypothetical protein
MKIKRFIGIAFLAIVTLVSVNVSAWVLDGDGNWVQDEEEEYYEPDKGVNECPITTYNRNFVESYDYITLNGTANTSGSFNIGGRIVTVTIGMNGKLPVRVPVCNREDDNCCKKTWISGPIQYL